MASGLYSLSSVGGLDVVSFMLAFDKPGEESHIGVPEPQTLIIATSDGPVQPITSLEGEITASEKRRTSKMLLI